MRAGAGTGATGLKPALSATKAPALSVLCKGWLQGDHLGSTAIAANADGTLSSEQRYKPWGEKRYPTGGSTLPTTFRFTGQRQERSLGLMDYNARFYSPRLGRFVSADSIVPGMAPVAFDRYAYVMNNPLRYADPTGHWAGPAAYGDLDQDPVIVMLNVNQAQFANGSNQFDVVGYESMTGLCGTVTFAVFYLSQMPQGTRSARTVDDVVAQLDEAGIDINYNGAGDIAAMAAEYGWDSLGGNPQIALSTNKETCLQTLVDYMNAGWMPIVRTWSNSSGALLDNTGQTMTLNDTGESYTNGTGHWVGIVGIAVVNGEMMVRIYNPAQGFAWVSWNFLYDNLTIDWQSVEEIAVDGEKKKVVTVYGHSVIALIRPPCGPDPVLVRPNPRDNKPIPI